MLWLKWGYCGLGEELRLAWGMMRLEPVVLALEPVVLALEPVVLGGEEGRECGRPGPLGASPGRAWCG
ncbi:MAG TPA: hypothetical protein VFV73_04700 [Streptosporangiaceae bacterium]|nr:hypothetical protein [Streptosporangiaceae bacterium]